MVRRAINHWFRSLRLTTALVVLLALVLLVAGCSASLCFWLMNGVLPPNLLLVIVVSSTAAALPLIVQFTYTIRGLEASSNRLKTVRDELSDRIEQLDSVACSLEEARVDLEAQICRRTRELEAARSAAEEAIRAKSAFFSTMSHELRTPLNAVIGFSDLMADPHFLSEQERSNRLGCIEEYANIINHSGHRLLSFIGDLIDLSNVNSGKVDLRIERIDMVSLIEKVEAMITPEIESRDQTLICLVDPAAGSLEADRRALYRILVNLLGNATRYSPPEATIVLSVTGVGDNIAFTVRDEGKGMVPAEIREATQPATRLTQKNADSMTSAGLGLYIATELAQTQGGSLTVTSEPGKGTEARVMLPHRIAASTPSMRDRSIRDAVA